MTNLTPQQIVDQLSRHVIGQEEAKRAVAIALRNRWRRKQVTGEMQQEITPPNILMAGPTGVGKTEIARRLAKMSNSPFLKVEATKFTEVGYVGRDVDSIIRDLLDGAIILLKEKAREDNKPKAHEAALIRLINAIAGKDSSDNTKRKYADDFNAGKLNDMDVEIEIADTPPPSTGPSLDIPGMPGGGIGIGMISLGDILGKSSTKKKLVTMKVPEAYEKVLAEESEKTIDEQQIINEAIASVENDGIVFIDEIDKIIPSNEGRSSSVNREGVQRELLPLIEGTTVATKYGSIKTDHILFIASGAFHLAKPSDLLPELQGRFPIRVELKPLEQEDMVRILQEPEFNLPKQYQALMAVEDVSLEFSQDGIERIAELATQLNNEVENIGARRLQTVIELLFAGLNFTASDRPNTKILVNAKYVDDNLSGEEGLIKKLDLSRFIL